jgi:hypothetical protein
VPSNSCRSWTASKPRFVPGKITCPSKSGPLSFWSVARWVSALTSRSVEVAGGRHRLPIANFPYFREIAPHVKAFWPDTWSKMLGLLDDDTLAALIDAGDGPLVDLTQFAKPARHNGAGAPAAAAAPMVEESSDVAAA